MAVILVVEDDVDFHRLYKAWLEPLGHDVLLVETAEDALDLVERRPFDLAIVDLMLPGMDGAELTRRLRRRPETADIPIIIFTNMPQRIGATFDESDRSWLPADAVVDKMKAENVLCAAVEKLLGRVDAHRTASQAPGGSSFRHVRTTCPYCGAGCGMYLKVRRGRLAGVAPADAHPVSRGRLCAKGWTAYEPVNHPDRLKHPLIRRGGRLVPAGWDEALDLCATRFRRIKSDKGPDALGVFGSAHCTNEENYLAQKMARVVFGTNNVDHGDRTCHSPTVAGLLHRFGWGAMTNSIEEIADASCIFAIGADVTDAHPLIGWRVRRAKDHGAFLIVADPRRTELAKCADIHLAHMPGTDLALLNAMANVIISEGLFDERFVAGRTEGFDELREVVARYSPETAAAICKVPAGLIRDAARAYAQTKPASLLYALGITGHTIGADSVMAVGNLAMMTGNVGRLSSGVNPLRGQNNVQGACDMGALPDYYPGYQAVDDPSAHATFEQAWGAVLPRKPGLTTTDMLIAAGRGDLAGLYVIGEDPVRSEPNVGLVERRLVNLDFLVCQDMFMSETCRLADVVLPAAAFAEKDGTFTNSERRVQRVRKAVEPAGEAWPDWRIICAISGRMGNEMNYAQPSQIMDEIASVTPIYSGISYDRIDRVGLQWPCPDRTHPGTVFLHEGGSKPGKGRFYGREYRPPAETPDSEYPLVLTTGRMLFHHNVGAMTRRSEILDRERPRNFAMINRDDSRRLGVVDGGLVRITTRRASLVVAAEVTEDIRPGVIWMPFHFAETPANRLTDDADTPVSRTGEYEARAARVEPVEVTDMGVQNA